MATASPMSHIEENSSSSDTGDILNCPICLERLTKPKYVPCLHTFCESCLNTYIISTHTDKDSGSFLCPVCRQRVEAPDMEAVVEEWAGMMPLNQDIFEILSKSEDKIEHLCGTCERADESTPAKFWCMQCQDCFCDACNNFVHTRMKNFNSHEVMLVEHTNQMTLNISHFESCLDHKGEVLKVYCLDHQVMCCVLCLAIDHRRCERIKTLEEMAGEMKSNPEVKDIIRELNDIDMQTELLRKSKEENICHLNKTHVSMRDRVSEMVDDVKLKLDKCHADFNAKFDGIHKKKTMELAEKKELIENFQKLLANGQKMLQVVSGNVSEKQIFVILQKLKSQLLSLAKELHAAMEDDKFVDFNLSIEQTFKNVSSIDCLSEVTLKEKPGKNTTLQILKAVESFSSCMCKYNAPDIEKMNAIKLFEIQSEKPSWFTGGLFLDKGWLLFSDNTNKKLKVYDASGNFKYEHKLNYEPWDVVMNEHSNKVYVSDRDSASVRTYIPSQSKLTECGCMKIQNKVCGIDFAGDKLLCCDQSKVELLDTGGKVVKSFQYKCNQYICTSKKESKFYYTYENEVICKSFDGNDLFRYSHPELKAPRGVTEDNNGNVYVCGMDSGNIHIISQDGKRSIIVLNKFEHITEPYAIGLDQTEKRFFITPRIQSQPIEIYEMSLNQS